MKAANIIFGAAGTLLFSGCAAVSEALGVADGGMSAETAERLTSAGEAAAELSSALPFPFDLIAAAAGGALMLWGGAKGKTALSKVATSVAAAAAKKFKDEGLELKEDAEAEMKAEQLKSLKAESASPRNDE